MIYSNKYPIKRISCYALLCFVYTSIVSSQQNFNLYDHKGHERELHHCIIIDIVENIDKGLFILCILSDNNNQIHQPYLYHLNQNLSSLNEVLLESKDLDNLKSIVILPDGNLQIFGNQKIDGIFHPYSQTIDPECNMIGSSNIRTATSTFIGDAVQVDSSNVVIAQSAESEGGIYNISLFQLDLTQKNELWNNRIYSSSNEIPTHLELLPNGNYIVLAKRYDPSFSTFSPIIYNVSPLGEKMWEKDLTSNVLNFYNNDVTIIDENSFLYMASYSGRNTASPHTYLIKINLRTGNTISKTVIDTLRANGIMHLDDNTYILYGSVPYIRNSKGVLQAGYMVLDITYTPNKIHKINTYLENDKHENSNATNDNTISSDYYKAFVTSNNEIILGGAYYGRQGENIENIINQNQYNILILTKIKLSNL